MNIVESHSLSVPSVGQSIPCRCKLGICATNCFLEFQEVLRGNEAHNFRSGGIHDRDADTRPWITDTCAASMALKASSSIFIKCHILPKLTLLTTWIVADLPRQRNQKKLGIKRTWSPGVNYFPRGKVKTSTRQTKTKSRKMQQSSDSRRLKLTAPEGSNLDQAAAT